MLLNKNEKFTLVGEDYRQNYLNEIKLIPWYEQLRDCPWFSAIVLVIVVSGCFFSDFIINHDPNGYYLLNLNEPPNCEFYFGTDSLGRDIYSIIWHGGKYSLTIGFLSASVTTLSGVFYGCISGMASEYIDNLLMRIVEILQSIPRLLITLLMISLMGTQNIVTLSLVIGGVGWFALARIVRGEVRQIRNSEYILIARCMGCSLPYLIRRHLIPNVISAIMFVIISSVSVSMIMESTLSFLGLGLPVETLSWGSILSIADKALLLNTWWVIVFPGLFLIVTLVSISGIGHYFRKQVNNRQSNL
ncbi:ABC transporter permease [Salmonella enterica]|nr:ABC transporter permease [Salmonella enterica]